MYQFFIVKNQQQFKKRKYDYISGENTILYGIAIQTVTSKMMLYDQLASSNYELVTRYA